MSRRDVPPPTRLDDADQGYFDRSDPWRLVQRAHDPARAARDETLFCLANGFLGVRGGFEESTALGNASFLAEVYEKSPIAYHERFPGFARTTDTRVPVADGSSITVRLDGLALDPAQAEWLAFERVLDLRAGVTTRRLRLRSANGACVEIHAERVVALDTPHLLVLRYRVASIDFAGEILLDSAISAHQRSPAQGDDPRIGAGAGLGLRLLAAHADRQHASVLQSTARSAVAVACFQRHVLGDDGLHCVDARVHTDVVHQVFAATLTPGASVMLEKYVAYAWQVSAADPNTLLGVAARFAQGALERGYAAIAAAQRNVLDTFWSYADLAIDGDPASALALHFNQFHLFQSVGRDGRASIAAKGLTGEGYEGHYFWDAETFVLPVFALTAPTLARSMLEYRHATLDAARRHARELNHARGALFAWRTISGDECSAYFPSGSAQYHINAAIAFAVRQYMDASDDVAFMLRAGAELLLDTARIWLQIGHFSARRGGAFCIDEVTGPDEYSALVDNNFYTNRMAQAHLQYAVAVAHWLAAEHPRRHAELCSELELDAAEIHQFSRAAEAMWLTPDADLGIFAQDDGFLDKPRWNAPAQDTPLLLQFHPLTIYRHQVCKQADVVLALVLAGADIDLAQKRRNFDYYEAITVHDSTLSASTFSVLASEVGYADRAYRYFRDTLCVDLDDLHGNTDHGAHMAAMAGSWMALSWGFGGMRFVGGRLTFAPVLPQAWRGYRFNLCWRGARLQVEVARDSVTYRVLDDTTLELWHRGERLQLAASNAISRPLVASRAPSSGDFPRRFDAVIFDLDGVIADTATVHSAAWQRLAAEIGVPFDASVGERLKGVDRAASLEIVLERAHRSYDAAEKNALAERKNSYYRAAIENLDEHALLPGALEAIAAARAAGLKVGLASASRNAAVLLQRLGIAAMFDHVADAAAIAHAKPDPEIFLQVAAALAVPTSACLGIEDAAAGVLSIKAAGMTAIGIGDAHVLRLADAVVATTADLQLDEFVLATNKKPPRDGAV